MKKEIKNGYVALEAEDGMVLHRRGDGYMQDPVVCATCGADDDRYEEMSRQEYMARRLDEYRGRVYRDRLSAAVHERYSVDDEIALAANINGPMLLAGDDGDAAAEEVAEEWAEYQRYRAECKARVRAEVEAITEVPDDPDDLIG